MSWLQVSRGLIDRIAWLALFGCCLLPQRAHAQIESSLPSPIISIFQPEGCVTKGELLTIVGSNFSDARGNQRVILWSAGREVEAQVVTWQDSEVRVRVPDDTRISAGQRYEVRFEGSRGQFRGGGGMLLICQDEKAPKTVAKPTAAVANNDLIAQRLVAAVMKASGADHWPHVTKLNFTFHVAEGERSILDARHEWNVKEAIDTVSWGGKTVAVNVQQPEKDPDQQAAYQRWINDAYWLLAPLKLADRGVKVAYRGRQTIGTKVYQSVNISFNRVGLTPGDQYNLYIDPATYRVRFWDYLPAGGKNVRGTWDGYRDFGGLKLATEHMFGGKRIWFTDVKVERGGE